MSFVHLRARSNHSLGNGLADPSDLAEKASADGLSFLTLCDTGRTSGHWQFQKACRARGVTPIFGVELGVGMPVAVQQSLPGELDEIKGSRLPMVFLAKNQAGYRQINAWVSQAASNNPGQSDSGTIPGIDFDVIENYQGQDLWVLSGFDEGCVGILLALGLEDLAFETTRRLQSVFGDSFFLEVQRDGLTRTQQMVEQTLRLSQLTGAPLVATHKNYFLHRSDQERFLLKQSIAQGVLYEDLLALDPPNPSWAYKSAQDMIRDFSDLPDALENTVHIAQSCNCSIVDNELHLHSLNGSVHKDMEQIRVLADQGLQQRLDGLAFDSNDTVVLVSDVRRPRFETEQYRARLHHELSVIEQMGFASYFLTVRHFVHTAKSLEIAVGPGRGSGAGSLVAYCLGITDIDPLEHGLIFERFLNPERKSLPDFDIDFCRNRRPDLIAALAKEFSDLGLYHLSTFNTLKSKSAITAVARAHNITQDVYQKWSDMIPVVGNEPCSLIDAPNQSEPLRQAVEKDEVFRVVFEQAKSLENQPIGQGVHPAGVVLTSFDTTNLCASSPSRNGSIPVLQVDKDDAQEMGLIKYDLLGLNNLTILGHATEIIKTSQPDFSLPNAQLNDPAVLDLFAKGQTFGVFQSDSNSARTLGVRIAPDNFDDLIVLLAINRPGPLGSGLVEEFIQRKDQVRKTGELDPAWFAHSSLQLILRSTLGLIVFQEQVMQTAQVIAGFTAAQADSLRVAMSKKNPQIMADLYGEFVNGALAQGHSRRFAQSVFQQMEKFSGYGFNRAHSAAYATLAYQTAFLKVHYPAQYLTALLTGKASSSEAVESIIKEFVPRQSNESQGSLAIELPCINRSRAQFSVQPSSRHHADSLAHDVVVYGLQALKGLGPKAAQAVVQARNSNGKPWDHVAEFLMDTAAYLNKSDYEILAKSGALNCLNIHRAKFIESLPRVLPMIRSEVQADLAKSQESRQAFIQDKLSPIFESHRAQEALDWTDEQAKDFLDETLGFHWGGDLLDKALALPKSAGLWLLKDAQTLAQEKPVSVWLAGRLVSCTPKKTKHGHQMAILSLEQGGQRQSVMVWPEVYEKTQKDENLSGFLKKGALLATKVLCRSVQFNGTTQVRMEVESIMPLADWLKHHDTPKKQNLRALPDSKPELIVTLANEREIERFKRGAKRHHDPQAGVPVRILIPINVPINAQINAPHYESVHLQSDQTGEGLSQLQTSSRTCEFKEILLPKEFNMKVTPGLFKSIEDFVGQGNVKWATPALGTENTNSTDCADPITKTESNRMHSMLLLQDGEVPDHSSLSEKTIWVQFDPSTRQYTLFQDSNKQDPLCSLSTWDPPAIAARLKDLHPVCAQAPA